MSRFAGWTAESLAKKTVKKIPENIRREIDTPKLSSSKPDYVGLICDALELQGLDGFVREYKFLEDRRFRFDIAYPALHIAIEFEGGVFTRGRHTRSTGYISDCKKYNLATMHGWKLFRFTTADTKSDTWAYDIAKQIRDFVYGGR